MSGARVERNWVLAKILDAPQALTESVRFSSWESKWSFNVQPAKLTPRKLNGTVTVTLNLIERYPRGTGCPRTQLGSLVHISASGINRITEHGARGHAVDQE